MAAVYWMMEVHVTPNWWSSSVYDCLDDSVVGERPELADCNLLHRHVSEYFNDRPGKRRFDVD
jgi:hypothetical protein